MIRKWAVYKSTAILGLGKLGLGYLWVWAAHGLGYPWVCTKNLDPTGLVFSLGKLRRCLLLMYVFA